MEQRINEIEINGIKYIPKDHANIQVIDTNGLKAVLVRSYAAGVHYGYLKSKVSELNGVNVVLVNTRRIWYWNGANSISQIALEGVKKPDECKISVIIPENEIINCVEIIPLTEKALESLNKVPIWRK